MRNTNSWLKVLKDDMRTCLHR